MKGAEKLDIKEIEKMKICRDNLDLMQKHIVRLEKYAQQIDDIIGLTSMDSRYKINAIARLTDTIMQFI